MVQTPTTTVDVGMQMIPSDQRIWALKPGVDRQFGVDVAIDSLGLRESVDEGRTYRWLTIGDSSIFGHGLRDDQTLHHHLEATLLQRGLSVDVVCGGIPGYSTLQSVRLLDEVGWDLNPDVLIIGSLWSDNNFDHFVDEEWLATLDSPATRFQKIMMNSAVFRWLRLTVKPVQVTKGDPHSKVSWLRTPYETGRRRVPVQLYGATLDKMIVEAIRREIVVVVLQPGNRYRLSGMSEEATWDVYFEPQRDVAKYRAIPIIDAVDVWRLFGLSSEGAFVDEMHPSGVANQWLAAAIVDLLVQRDWPSTSVTGNGDLPPWNGAPQDRWSTSEQRTNIGQDLPDYR